MWTWSYSLSSRQRKWNNEDKYIVASMWRDAKFFLVLFFPWALDTTKKKSQSGNWMQRWHVSFCKRTKDQKENKWRISTLLRDTLLLLLLLVYGESILRIWGGTSLCWFVHVGTKKKEIRSSKNENVEPLIALSQVNSFRWHMGSFSKLNKWKNGICYCFGGQRLACTF